MMMAKKYPPPEDRFWINVLMGLSYESCWNWIGYKTIDGYGRFRGYNNKKILAHRFSWKLHYDNIPKDLFVLHHCDNPACVNPRHLFLGTHQDNANDSKRKNRRFRARGEISSLSKLTTQNVLDIRQRSWNGERNCDLAKEYNVDPSTIYSILKRKTWAWLD
jgi:hypothetical protein